MLGLLATGFVFWAAGFGSSLFGGAPILLKSNGSEVMAIDVAPGPVFKSARKLSFLLSTTVDFATSSKPPAKKSFEG